MLKKNKNKKKRSLLLLETLIAFFLVSILLFALFSFLEDFFVFSKEKEKKWERISSRYATYALLETTLGKAQRPQKEFIFEIKEGPFGKELHFIYEHPPVLDPFFSSFVYGVLYKNEDNQIEINLKPFLKEEGNKGAQEREKKLLLKEGVSSMEIVFFSPKKQQKIVSTNHVSNNMEIPPRPLGEWTHFWHTSYNDLPPWVEIILTSERGSEERYPIFLINSKLHPSYK